MWKLGGGGGEEELRSSGKDTSHEDCGGEIGDGEWQM